MADEMMEGDVECQMSGNRKRHNIVVPAVPSFARYRDAKALIYCWPKNDPGVRPPRF